MKMNLRVFGISGSARADGNTAIIMRMVFAELNQAGIETELVQLHDLEIAPCKGCFACKGKGNCVFRNDAFTGIFQKMCEADGMLLGSPVYSADVSAKMKALLERAGVVAAVNPGLLKGKVGAAVSAVRRGGGMTAVDTMNHFFLNKEMIVPGSTYWNMVYGRTPGEVENDAEGVANMRNLGRNMAHLLLSRHPSASVSPLFTATDVDIESLAAENQRQARDVVRASGVREAWESIGATVNPVGSLPMGLLMKHRDIDFHIYTDRLDLTESFKAVSQICANPNVTRFEYRNLAATVEACFEWHVWYRYGEEEWRIDMIQILRGSQFDGYFEHVAERIQAVLTPEMRRAILKLKYLTPETEPIMGIEYYQAVIADGIRTYPEFLEWRNRHPVNGILTWRP